MTNEQAIDVLNMVEAHGLADEAKKLAIKALQNDRPQGEWEKIITYYNDAAMCLYGEFKCSCCGHLHTFYEIPETNKFNTDNFCGYCGADMRGDDNEQ